jgi:hypothetical protein
MEINPRLTRTANILKSITGAGTVYAVPAINTGQKFFLTAVNASYTKVAADTGIEFSVKATPAGSANANIIKFAGVTLTAAQETTSLPIVPPLEIEPGTNISTSQNGTYTVSSANIIGILVQNQNG